MVVRDYLLIGVGMMAGWSFDGIIHRSFNEFFIYGACACIGFLAIWLATPHENANTLT